MALRHNRALNHGRVYEFTCENVRDNCKPKVIGKNNVLDKNGSNESKAMRWAKGVNSNMLRAGRVKYQACTLYNFSFPTTTTYNCAEIMRL